MPSLRTPLTRHLGLDVPIVQAPIGSATSPELAAAVSEAGGLGTLAVTWRDPDAVPETVAATRERTDGPVGTNVVVDPDATATPAVELVDACLAADVDVLSLSFGDASPHVDRAHDAGVDVWQTVGSAAEAREAAAAGVDAVVAQGAEAGGHLQSDVSTMVLVPRVVDTVDVPVVAAGGIGDGRGVAAVLALGADAAWLGTRFVATREANVHERYRRRVVDADETDTVSGAPFDRGWSGVPHRVLQNATTDAWEDAGRPPRGDRPGEDDLIGRVGRAPVRRYEDSLATPDATGDVAEFPLYAGQSSGLVRTVEPAASVVDRLATEARAALRTGAR
ncbi:NAD(P)H-dependent flavin oxidoreductase [Salinigranum salinum]|uniref:NAD(P)H-dependent flavin oxidoreductase n=1 Tax=Salinigranum salinum TaxID=1364937 RepID=UPI0012603FAB|nr:nitronate monooxygenase [Salinigranum salinum]